MEKNSLWSGKGFAFFKHVAVYRTSENFKLHACYLGIRATFFRV